MRGNRRRAIVVMAIVVALATVAVAYADVTREEYVAQAEPICKTNTDQNAKLLKGVRAQVKAGKTRPAARKFLRAATAFSSALDQVEALEEPTADATTLSTWMGYLRLEVAYLRKTATALKHGNLNQAQGYSIRLNRNGKLANNVVIGFGFNYCLIKPNRFS